MFKTSIGSLPKESTTLYLRPAQGVFGNFMTGQKSTRIAVFRNEIRARQFIFRMRE